MSKGDIVLNQLAEAHDVVGCFVTVQNRLLIVESECVRHGGYSSNWDYDSLEVSTLLGYTIGAILYREPLTDTDYLFLVRRDGAMVIMDMDLKVIDTFDTGIYLYQATHSMLFAFEEKQRQVYCNLEPNTVYTIRLQQKSGVLTFLHASNSLSVVQDLDSEIMALDITFNYDISTNKEFVALATLSRCDKRKQHYLQAVARVDIAGSSRQKPKWGTAVARTVIDLGEEPFVWDVCKDSVLMKSVENVGFFVFSTVKFFFFSMPNGFENAVGGEQLVNNMYQCQEPFEGYGIDISNPSFKFQGLLHTHVSHDLIEFSISTTDFKVVLTTFKLILEDENKYVKNWSTLNTTVASLLTDGVIDIKTDRVEALFPLVSNKKECLLNLRSGKMVLMDVHEKRIISSSIFNNENYVTATSIGTLSSRFIRSGYNIDNTYFVEQQPHRYSLPYTVQEKYDVFDKIQHIWRTSDNKIYWMTSLEDSLYLNGKVKCATNGNIYVTKNDLIIKDADVVQLVDIQGSLENGYCCLARTGELKWVTNNTSKTVELDSIKTHHLSKAVIYSTQKPNGINMTYVVYENRLLTIEQYGDVITETILPRDIGTVNSMISHTIDNVTNILITDVHGKVWIFDDADSTSATHLNISFYPIRVLYMITSDLILLFSKDSCFILKPYLSVKLHYKCIPIDLPFSIRQAVYDDSILTIATDDNHILDLNFESLITNQQKSPIRSSTDILITKFLEITYSNKYVLGSYVTLEDKENRTFGIQSSGVCSYNMVDHKVETKYDVSSEFQNATVTDICSVPYRNIETDNSLGNDNISFAKRLIFSQCFLVSLNCELSETDEGPKLLLFMVDPESGQINLRTYSDTFFDINSVQNYSRDTFIAVGDYIQLFRIDYSVTENIFHITMASDKHLTNGLVRSLFELPLQESDNEQLDSPRKKKQRRQHKLRTAFVGLDLYKGIYEFKIESSKVDSSTNVSKEQLLYSIKYIKSTDEHPIPADLFNEEIISKFSFNKILGSLYFIVCCGLNHIKLYFTTNTDDDAYDMLEFYFPHQVTSIEPLSRSDDKDNDILDTALHLSGIFSITTTNGGHYVISTLPIEVDQGILSSNSQQMMSRHLPLMGYVEEEESIVRFIDNRILKDAELNLV
mgnify:CR=1 FL=1